MCIGPVLFERLSCFHYEVLGGEGKGGGEGKEGARGEVGEGPGLVIAARAGEEEEGRRGGAGW